MKLVECVPNFSEGRDRGVIDAISAAIESVEGVQLLDVDPGEATNRTVVTFVGTPSAVKEAAFQGIKKASQLIDMRKHKGAHARMGATDVCPFVPVSEVTTQECVQLAKELGKRVAEELDIPVYLYEYAATTPERKNLANIRKGEYEGLEEKLKDPHWKPDFGEPKFNPKSGATVIGVREFLIAYNINLNTTDKKKARDIALTIREKGRWKRDENQKIVRDENGKKVRQPGLFQECKATGWYIDEYKQAQITMNLTNYNVTPPHLVFDKCCELAWEKGLRVTGSELVGLVPKEAMLMAGRYYLAKQGKSEGVPEKELIRVAIQSMGLNDVAPFDPKKKIIEYYVEDRPDALVNMTVSDFADELSSDSPAPGGGSVAALCGSLSAALSSMVANLTHGKKGYRQYNAEMNDAAVKAQELKKQFLEAIDTDTDAFNQLMKAMKMKEKTDQQKKQRAEAIQEATKQATQVPLSVLRLVPRALEVARVVVEKGNKNSISDAGVAAVTARAAAEGAWFNVMINLQGIEDEKFKSKTIAEAKQTLEEVREKAAELEGMVTDYLVPKVSSPA